MASTQSLPDLTNPRITMPGKIKSKAQMGLMGMVASGKKKLPGMSSDKAKEMLKGTKKKRLPDYRKIV